MRTVISIVVPVYNVAQYLPECIDSILAQTFRDFELILVDDGSIDESGRICDEYADKDERIQVIHQKNGGVTKARKTGVESAKGEWTCFVDADDTIPKDSLETLMSATESNTDIVVARCDDRKMPESMSLEEYRRCCIAGRKVHSGPFARAFRSNLFNSQTFDIPREIIRGEDLIMNVRLAFTTDKAPILINKKVYNYRQNEDSVMHTSKHSVSYSTFFFQHLILSIPTPEKYEKEVISRKLSSIHNIIMDAPSDCSWRNSEFWYTLKQQMQKSEYKMSLQERIMLKVSGKNSLRFALRLCHLLDIMEGVLPSPK